MRLHITGNAGAGKTTLAKALALSLDLPLHHLDSIVWQPGWQKTDAALRDKQEQALADGQRWVIEGVSHLVRKQADLTLFLDVPRRTCLARCVKRNLPFLFKSRPELPPNCPEILIFRQLLLLIWRFPNRAGARIRREAQCQDKVVCIRDAQQAAAAVASWQAAQGVVTGAGESAATGSVAAKNLTPN